MTVSEMPDEVQEYVRGLSEERRLGWLRHQAALRTAREVRNRLQAHYRAETGTVSCQYEVCDADALAALSPQWATLVALLRLNPGKSWADLEREHRDRRTRGKPGLVPR